MRVKPTVTLPREWVEKVRGLVKSLPPISSHAEFSIEYSRKNPGTHSEYKREDREDWTRFKEALAAVEAGLPETPKKP